MSYTLRSKSGEMKAKVSNLMAEKIMNKQSGFFKGATDDISPEKFEW